MGTRGYKVYRHKGRYFRRYNHLDSYPSVYGLKVLREVPKTPDDFQRWLKTIREELDSICNDLAGSSSEDSDCLGYNGLVITKTQPQTDIMIEWVYEIDLDNLVFHVDAKPLFRLDHLPPRKWFIKGIGYDYYGHRSFTVHTPEKYRYNWTAPPSPPDDGLLTVYREHVSDDDPLLIQDLLLLPEVLSDVERCRLSLLELLVGHYMLDHFSGHFIRKLESIPSRNLISERGLRLSYSFLALALCPMIFPSKEIPVTFEALSSFVWLQGDLCLRITTHLNDEPNLQAAVGEIVREVKKKVDQEQETGAGTKTNVFYGVAFSTFHCVIVKIEAKDGYKCKHTSALQFLPSWHGDSPSTPGITALARLSVHLESQLEPFSHLFKLVHGDANPSTMINPANIISTIPQDVCENITQFMYSPTDILAFGLLSPACKAAADRILRYPHISVTSPTRGYIQGLGNSDKLGPIDYRLLSPVGPNLDCYPDTKDIQEDESQDEDDDDEGSDDDNDADIPPGLHMVEFSAITDKGNVVLQLGYQLGYLLSAERLQMYLDKPTSFSWRSGPLECEEMEFDQ